MADRFAVFFYLNDREISIKVMILLRALGALLASGSLVLTFLVAADRCEYFTYYSHWCMLMAVGMFAFGIISSVAAHKRNRMIQLATTDAIFESDTINCNDHLVLSPSAIVTKPNWLNYVQWTFNNVAISSNLLASVVYLMVLGKDSSMGSNKNFTTIVITSTAHIISLLAVIGELVMGAVPVRLIDIYQPLTFNVVYGIFYLAYRNTTNREIYSYITNANEMVLMATILMLLQIILYCLIFCVNYIKCKCKKFIVE